MSFVEIRKLRKKIRQIECLERLDRELTIEERHKVQQKPRYREQLQELIGSSATAQSTAVIDHTQLDDTSISQDSSAISVDSDMISNSSQTAQDISSVPQKRRRPEESAVDQDAKMRKCVTKDAAPLCQSFSATATAAAAADAAAGVTATFPPVPSPSSSDNSKMAAIERTSDNTSSGSAQRCDTFIVRTLSGHDGMVTAMSMVGGLLATGSQDTTIKVWNTLTGMELRSFGGHKQTVTAVCLLDHAASLRLAGLLNSGGEEDASPVENKPRETGDDVGIVESLLVLSASLDCTVRIWSIQLGSCLQSIYTFHPLTCMSYIDSESVIVCGSDGGKLELWKPSETTPSGPPLEYIVAHDAAITDVAVEGRMIYTSSADGLIGVFEWRLSDNRLHRLFESGDVCMAAKVRGSDVVYRRAINCVVAKNGIVFYGDDGANVKVLDWKAGVIRRLTSHMTEFGSTDGLCIADELLVMSGYDLDNGLGYINVRQMPDQKYVYTLCDEQTSRIYRVASCQRADGRLLLATGGAELKLWIQCRTTDSDVIDEPDNTFRSVFIGRFDKLARHSDVEADSDGGEDSDGAAESLTESEEPSLPWHHSPQPEEQRAGLLSWCTLT